MIALVGLILGREKVQGEIVSQVQALIGPQGAAVINAMTSLQAQRRQHFCDDFRRYCLAFQRERGLRTASIFFEHHLRPGAKTGSRHQEHDRLAIDLSGNGHQYRVSLACFFSCQRGPCRFRKVLDRADERARNSRPSASCREFLGFFWSDHSPLCPSV